MTEGEGGTVRESGRQQQASLEAGSARPSYTHRASLLLPCSLLDEVVPADVGHRQAHVCIKVGHQARGLAKRVIACMDVRANDNGDLVVTKGDQYDVREASSEEGGSSGEVSALN